MSRVDVETVKGRHALSAVVGRDVRLRQSGQELLGLCPFHDERSPSFRVNDGKGVFHCFGCGAGGDIIDYVMWREGLPFLDAVQWLEGEIPAAFQPVNRDRQRQLEREARAAAVATAQAQWASSQPISGTPAERYLRSRGLTLAPPPSIRFARLPLWRSSSGAAGPKFPALIAACETSAGDVVGVQRIFLTNDGKKAPIRNPKLSLGQVRGCALRLGPVRPEIILCEGPEDGLTLQQRYPAASVWVSLGTGNLSFVELPLEVKSVVLAGDNNEAGYAAVDQALRTFDQRGLEATAVFPDLAFNDWNDELMGVRR